MLVYCKYPGCQEKADSLDEALCVFHAPKSKKGISGDEFNKRIFRKFDRANHNFEGYIFPTGIRFGGRGSAVVRANFRGARFEGKSKKTFRGTDIEVCADFEGYRFGGEADFTSAKFLGGSAIFYQADFSGGDAIFTDCEFSGGDAIFSNATFSGGKAVFRKARFRGGDADFGDAEFSGGLADFGYAEFGEGRASFSQAKFSKGEARFRNARFLGENTYFIRAEFTGGNADFARIRFSGHEMDFTEAKFAGGDAIFYEAEFAGRKVTFGSAVFADNIDFDRITIESDLHFSNLTLAEKAIFLFRSPRLPLLQVHAPIITFYRIRFNPFATHFEDISVNLQTDSSLNFPMLVFRFCRLKDVYFSNNDMSLFSFFRSSFFEDAHFDSIWFSKREERILKIIPIVRKSIILEDLILNGLRGSGKEHDAELRIRESYEIEWPRHFKEVASLYRRMKTAMDRGKDYQESSWFYFNEYEMKRLGLKEGLQRRRERLKWWRHYGSMSVRGRLYLFNMYKVFAGYGEKPGWSFVWFLVFVLMFSIAHLFNGIKVAAGRGINYDLMLNIPNIKSLISDLAVAAMFTLYRVIPTNYLPFNRQGLSPADSGFWDLLLSFANTVILLLMIIFTGMGLKRHFRRF